MSREVSAKPRRPRRWPKALLWILGTILALPLALELAIKLPWVEHRLERFASNQLTSALNGRIEVEFETPPSLLGFANVSGRVFDAEAQEPVILLESAAVDLEVIPFLWHWLEGDALVLDFPKIEAKELVVHLELLRDGTLSLVRALSPPREPESSSESGLVPRIRFGSIVIHELTVHQRMVEPWFEFHARDLRSKVIVANDVYVTAASDDIQASLQERDLTFTGMLAGSARFGEATLANVELAGSANELSVEVGATLRGERWIATSSLDGSSDAWASLALGYAPERHLTTWLGGEGDFSGAAIATTIRTGGSELRALTSMTFSPFKVDANLWAQGLALTDISSTSPQGSVNVLARTTVDSDPTWAGGLRLVSWKSRLENTSLPDFALSALARSPSSVDFALRSLDGSEFEVRGQLEHNPPEIAFSLDGSLAQLPDTLTRGAESFAALKQVRISALQFNTEGRFDTTSISLTGQAEVQARRISIPQARLDARGLHLRLSSSGPLERPRLNGKGTLASLRLPQLRLFDTTFELSSSARGARNARHPASLSRMASPPRTSKLDARSWLSVSTQGEFMPETERASRFAAFAATEIKSLSPVVLQSGHVDLRRGQQRLNGRFERLSLAEGVAVEALKLHGLGYIEVNGRYTGRVVDGRVRATQVNLGRLGEMLRPLVPAMDGELTADVALHSKDNRVSSGHAYLRAFNLELGSTSLGRVDAAMVFDDGSLSGGAQIARGSSWLRVDAQDVSVPAWLTRTDAEAPARSTDPTAVLSSFSGSLVVRGSADLKEVPELAVLIPDFNASGSVRLQGRIGRPPQGAPTAAWFVHVADFSLTGVDGAQKDPDEEDGTTLRTTPVWIKDLTGAWSLSYDGGSGQLSQALDVRDKKGTRQLIDASLVTTISPQTLLTADSSALARAPLAGTVRIPQLPLSDLPGGQVPTGFNATVRAHVLIGGQVSDPDLRGFVELEDFSVQSIERSLPVTLQVEGSYKDSLVQANARILREGRTVGTANAHGALFSEQDDFGFALELDEIPIGCFPYVRDYGVSGTLNADVGFHRKNQRQLLEAQLQGQKVSVVGVEIPRLRAAVDFKNGSLEAEARVVQDKGQARVTVSGTSPDGKASQLKLTELHLQAEHFQIRPLFLLAQQYVGGISGIIDGEVTMDLADPRLAASGELRLRDGSVHVGALGKEFREIQIHVEATPGKIQLRELRAHAGEGVIEGDGMATYDNSGLISGRARLRMPDDRPMPISREGLTIAEASGRIDIVASRDEETRLTLGVDIPELDVHIKKESRESLQSLSPSKAITLGVVTPSGRFISLESTPEKTSSKDPVVIKISLGDDVWLHYGQGVFASVDGEVEAALTDAVRLRGQLQVDEGEIDLMGRVFKVRLGNVTFQRNTPPDPDVVAEAAWTSPSGHTIIASFRGPLRSGKMTLRSEPPLSSSEILNVLLFDDPEGSLDTQQQGSSAASGVAATIAGAGLGRALSDLTNFEVKANVDTSDEDNPRPELGVRLSPRVSVGVSYNPASAPTTLSQTPDRAVVSLDLRLSKRWTLESSVGDKGSVSTDLVWRYRY